MQWNTWPDTPQEAAFREAETERRRMWLEDLARVAATPEGFRLLQHMLAQWGAETFVVQDPERMALRNQAERLLADLAQADPKTCLHLVAGLRDIPF